MDKSNINVHITKPKGVKVEVTVKVSPYVDAKRLSDAGIERLAAAAAVAAS